eukprot:scaffold66772_cov18-Tisochrysis_lutea.AAC.1
MASSIPDFQNPAAYLVQQKMAFRHPTHLQNLGTLPVKPLRKAQLRENGNHSRMGVGADAYSRAATGTVTDACFVLVMDAEKATPKKYSRASQVPSKMLALYWW